MKKIAHIEDSRHDQLLLEKFLPKKYRLHSFLNMASFLEDENAFDLVIADLCLPESYGVETVERIKRHHPETPILALTGVAGPYLTGDISKALIESGASNVAMKSVMNDPYLIGLIEELIAE